MDVVTRCSVGCINEVSQQETHMHMQQSSDQQRRFMCRQGHESVHTASHCMHSQSAVEEEDSPAAVGLVMFMSPW